MSRLKDDLERQAELFERYAGLAMQGILSRARCDFTDTELANMATSYALCLINDVIDEENFWNWEDKHE